MGNDVKTTEKDLLKGGLLVGAGTIADEEKQIISISPNIDLGLGGGIPEGSFVNLSGKEKSGKTTLALHIAAKAQRKEYGKRPTFLFDVEHRIKPMHLKGIKGLALADSPTDFGLKIIRSTRKNILSAEEILTAACDIIKNYEKAIIILDSTSSLCSSDELTKGITGSGRATGPRMMAQLMRQMGPVVPVQNTIFISIQHLIANTSGYGSPWYEDGGKKLQYQSDVKMRCKTSVPIEAANKQIGRKTTWEVLWSALGPPGAKIETSIRYGIGIDELDELIDLGLDFGLISKAGSWFETLFLDKHSQKVQGRESLYQMLANNSDYSGQLENSIKEMI